MGEHGDAAVHHRATGCPAARRRSALARATALSNAESTLRGGSLLAAIMIRISTLRHFILSGTKRDKLRMLLVCTPARQQGTGKPESQSRQLRNPQTGDFSQLLAGAGERHGQIDACLRLYAPRAFARE
jgi:hypothetical protein